MLITRIARADGKCDKIHSSWAKTAGRLPPLGRWLAEDLTLEADAAGGGVTSRGAALLGIAESTYRRRLRQAEEDGGPPRSPAWETLRPRIAELVRDAHYPGHDLLGLARDALLEEVASSLPDDTAAGAALMGVSQPTFRKWLAAAG